MKKTPFGYQKEAIAAALKGLAEAGKALVVMATGTGKTFVATLVLRALLGELRQDSKKVLVLAHEARILRQFRKTCSDEFGPEFEAGNLDGKDKSWNNQPFLFATFQSTLQTLEAFHPEEFDTIVVDEAHHGQADTYRKVIEYFRPKRVLGLTATPDRMDGKDIRDLFGDAVYDLSLVDAIVQGLVCQIDYRVFAADAIDKDALAKLVEEVEAAHGRGYTEADIDRRIFIKEKDEAIAEKIESFPGKGIVFCSSKLQAERFAELLTDAVPYHSGLPHEVNDQNFEAFAKGDIRYLNALNKLNEGADVPDAAKVAFLRATQSLRILLQQLGRGLRKAPGKTKVTILDFVGNVERLHVLHDLEQAIRQREALERSKQPVKEGDDEDGESDAVEVESNFHISYGDGEVVDLLELMKRVNGFSFYATLKEASAAAQKLGIETMMQYKAERRRDPRLPSTPNEHYSEWKRDGWTWQKFLGTEFYKTLKEASAAAQKLGIETVMQYKAERRRDPRLPSNPHTYYPEWKHDGWTWQKFLGKHSGIGFYKTLKEASAAAQKLGIETVMQYKAERPRDLRLPPKPEKYYPEWKRDGWTTPRFLGTYSGVEFYTTLEEASAAAQKLGIKTQSQYKAERHRDLRLPPKPEKYYPEWKRDGWTMPKFLGTYSGIELYKTAKEASAAAQKLGIKTKSQYKTRYHRDKRLPSNPNMYYPEWKRDGWTWPKFLGTEKK